MNFWQIALRPGKPMMNGHLGAMRVIGVPGNPVSSYVCTFIFGVPLIRALSGRSDIHHVMETAILSHDLPENDHRQEYLRSKLTCAMTDWKLSPRSASRTPRCWAISPPPTP